MNIATVSTFRERKLDQACLLTYLWFFFVRHDVTTPTWLGSSAGLYRYSKNNRWSRFAKGHEAVGVGKGDPYLPIFNWVGVWERGWRTPLGPTWVDMSEQQPSPLHGEASPDNDAVSLLMVMIMMRMIINDNRDVACIVAVAGFDTTVLKQHLIPQTTKDRLQQLG